MIINNMLYQNSSNALMQAKHYQSQISQKEFEIQLININSKYSSYGNDYNELQRQKNGTGYLEFKKHSKQQHL